MNWRILIRLIALSTLTMVLRVETPISISHQEVLPSASSQVQLNHLLVEQLYSLAQLITVKVFSEDTWGSGILIQKQGLVYTVLTNAHVLAGGNYRYRIQTHDGRLYSANMLKSVTFNGEDLALLQFQSPDAEYKIAPLGSSVNLSHGDEVFAAGFPFTANPSKAQGFVFTKGIVFSRLDKALNLGYQIGSTNEIEKGMSGGPLLNRWGEVVGINGMHKYPLWGDPYIFKDGSDPDLSLKQQMSYYSWAVPIETFVKLAPQLFIVDLGKVQDCRRGYGENQFERNIFPERRSNQLVGLTDINSVFVSAISAKGEANKDIIKCSKFSQFSIQPSSLRVK